MKLQTPGMRFELLVNGKPVCVAGIDGRGVLGAIIEWSSTSLL